MNSYVNYEDNHVDYSLSNRLVFTLPFNYITLIDTNE